MVFLESIWAVVEKAGCGVVGGRAWNEFPRVPGSGYWPPPPLPHSHRLATPPSPASRITGCSYLCLVSYLRVCYGTMIKSTVCCSTGKSFSWQECKVAAGTGAAAGLVTLYGHCTTHTPILANLPEKAPPYTFLGTVHAA